MKIAICVHNLTGGGAERVAALWAIGFSREGHQVLFILNTNEFSQTYEIPQDCPIKNIGYKTYGTSFIRLLRKIVRFFSPHYYENKLARILEAERPDVVICVMHPWDIWVHNAMARQKWSIPVVLTEHNAFDRPDLPPIEFKWKYESIKRSDYVTVLTDVDRKLIGEKLDRVAVLPNPLAFDPVKTIPKKDKIIFAAGRLDVMEVKGFDVLVKGWAKIAYKYPEWKLQIAGNGRPRSFSILQSIAEKECLNRTQFCLLGRCDNIIDYFQKSSIFVLSSRHEGFGLVLIEAMSQGCACIACDNGGRQKEIITNETEGLIISPGDVDAMADAIERLIKDAEYRLIVQNGGLKRASYYSLDNTMIRWNNIFNELKLL